MGDLSKNFSEKEFRCSCGCKVANVNPDLVTGLQRLRDKAGVSIRVTSGFRCPEHNKRIKGNPRSYHLTGEAADIVISGMSVLEMYNRALCVREFLLGGIGVYPDSGFIHVDIGPQRRWGRCGGRYMGLLRAFSLAGDR